MVTSVHHLKLRHRFECWVNRWNNSLNSLKPDSLWVYIYTEIRYSSWLIIGNWRLTFTQPTVNWSYIGLQRRHRCPLLDLAARRSLDVRLHLIWFHGVGSHLTVSFWYIYIYIYIHVIMYIYIYYTCIYICIAFRVAGAEQTLPEARNAHSWMAARW